MKTILTLTALFLSTHAFAQTPNGNASLPICNEEEFKFPCKLAKKDAYAAIADMMFANRKGFNEIAKKAPGIKRGITGGFMMEDVRVSFLKEESQPRTPDNHFPTTTTTAQYEVLLNDCRGTDACNGGYLWTVTEVTEGDGYTYESKYTNTLEKTDLDQLDPEENSEK
jgi:hypothetical protein